MSWKIVVLILFLWASIGFADDGPTILAPRPLPSPLPPGNTVPENVETLPIPRVTDIVVTPVETSPQAKELPKSGQPAPNGAEAGGKALLQPDVSRLIRETAVLRAEREKLKTEHDEITQPMGRADASNSGDIIKLRLRLAEILTKLGTQKPAEEARAPEKVSPGPGRAAPAVPPKTPSSEREKPPVPEPPKYLPMEQRPATSPESDKPLEPFALAGALFRTGDYEGALTTYRLIDPETLSKHDRVAVQYMQACCLRKLGKTDQAASLYREVANTKDDEVLAECAQWQMGALQWRRELETHLEQLRQRRQALEIKP